MSATKILFRQGTTAPSGQGFASTNGEPLWDKTNRKLYMTNGTNSPTLIGPVQSSQTTVFNDNIQNLSTDLGYHVSDPSGYTGLPVYVIGEPEENITQYWLDITDFLPAQDYPLGSAYFSYIDPLVMLNTVGTNKKITLFLSGAPSEDDPTWQNSWENTHFPLIWLSKDDEMCNLGIEYNFRIWDSGTKTFDTQYFGAIHGLTEYGIKTLYESNLAGDFFAGVKPILDHAKYAGTTKCTVKLEIIPTEISETSATIDIHITYPSNPAVVVQNLVNTANATQIATVNNHPIYIPAVNGQLAITGSSGVTVYTTGAQQVARATLIDYNPIGPVGSAASEEDANITPVSLTDAVESGPSIWQTCLCVQESSAFGSSSQVSYNPSDGSLLWTPSTESRSYSTAVITNPPTGGKITVSVNGIDLACQSDHYIYIYNNSGVSVTVEPEYSPDWTDYPVIGLPRATVLKDKQGVEMSLALRRYTDSTINTAVMTASEPLAGI